ncbi:MAG: hypothetical protein ACP5UM_01370 [Anaerolineae bacterium]
MAVGSAPHGRMQANLEEKGEPSKWLTLYGHWVLKALGRGQMPFP